MVSNYMLKKSFPWIELCKTSNKVQLPTNTYSSYHELMFIVVTDHEVVGSLTLPTSFVSILSTGSYIYINGWYCHETANGMARLYILNQEERQFSISTDTYSSFFNGEWKDFNVAVLAR